MSVTTLRPIGRRIHVRAELLARIDAVLTDESADHGDIAGFAECASARSLGIPAGAWTPEIEGDAVPRTLAEVCERCPVWGACLRDAIRMNDIGYRASTTTAQRRLLFPELAASGRSLAAVNRVADFGDDTERRPRHPRGEGSLSRYRRGCRCDECRGHNAAARRRERARAS